MTTLAACDLVNDDDRQQRGTPAALTSGARLMAHFYGAVKGQRGEATRLGSVKSNLSVVAASWQGSVRVYLYHDDETGNDMARVTLAPWQNGRGTDAVIYDGPVSGAGRVLTVEGQRVTTGEGDVIAAANAMAKAS